MHLYIHIPFCLQKCNYCDFISYAGCTEEEIGRYLAALHKEMELLASRFHPGKISTLYLGGGTPTLLAADQLVAVIDRVRSIFGLEEEAEVTVEANPGTVTFRKLRLLRLAGVNRLSLGVQSFDDDLLALMGRVHRAQDALDSISWARSAGFTNLNLDLIYGLPHQTLDQWENTLRQALSLSPEHLSLYAMELSEGSVWGERQAKGLLLLPDDEEVVRMLELACTMLRDAGFEHYEISNFCRKGFECRHNLAYWEVRDYLGVGAAAASCWKGRRWRNTGSLKDYCRAVEQGRLPVEEEEELDIRRRAGEFLFLGLRLRRGVNLMEFQGRFGQNLLEMFQKEIEWLAALGLVEIKEGYLRITDRGLPLANEVFMAFL